MQLVYLFDYLVGDVVLWFDVDYGVMFDDYVVIIFFDGFFDGLVQFWFEFFQYVVVGGGF